VKKQNLSQKKCVFIPVSNSPKPTPLFRQIDTSKRSQNPQSTDTGADDRHHSNPPAQSNNRKAQEHVGHWREFLNVQPHSIEMKDIDQSF
jgi:hypothetical protein